MARPELTAANSFLAFSIYTNRQVSCMGDGACLLCMFVDTFVYVSGCRHLYLFRGGVCVCVCVCVCVWVWMWVCGCGCVAVGGCGCVMHCGKPTCTTTFTYHVLLNIRTEYRHCSHWLSCKLPAATFTYNQHYHMHLPQTHIYHNHHHHKCRFSVCASSINQSINQSQTDAISSAGGHPYIST